MTASRLRAAAKQGWSDEVRFLVNVVGVDVSQGDGSGRTALLHACWSGHMETVRVLIGAGASVNQASSSGETPLMKACSKGFTEIASVLCAAGAFLTGKPPPVRGSAR